MSNPSTSNERLALNQKRVDESLARLKADGRSTTPEYQMDVSFPPMTPEERAAYSYAHREYFNGNPEATQKDCKHGYVLPDRCRYTAHLGCDCGEYPPLKWNPEKGQYEVNEPPK